MADLVKRSRWARPAVAEVAVLACSLAFNAAASDVKLVHQIKSPNG